MAVNARAILITKKILGTDTLVDKILQDPESAEAKLFVKARHLFNNHLKKQYIEASLLASQNLDEISKLLELAPELVIMYRDIYYDVTYLDRLSKLELLNVSDKGEGLLKLWAVSQGLPFIQWRLGGKVIVSPIEGLQDLFTTCIYKSKEAMFNPNTSEASKESTKYIKLAMDLARLLKVWVLDSAAAKHDIEIALREVMPEFEGLDALEAEMEVEEEARKRKKNKSLDLAIEPEISSLEIESFSLDDLMKENDDK